MKDDELVSRMVRLRQLADTIIGFDNILENADRGLWLNAPSDDDKIRYRTLISGSSLSLASEVREFIDDLIKHLAR